MAILLKPVNNYKEHVSYRLLPSKLERLQQEMSSCKSCQGDVVREGERDLDFRRVHKCACNVEIISGVFSYLFSFQITGFF